ncbi:uncharacterized protein LOC117578540 [Drosophila guanche]|uniref:Blast:GON-4-like protein n=1 Tax=Drosophila guanche TaxID=7266 RepID=A0A3B0JUS1_DROGU|nr:uncharacterized protein LOC117578540 [Drosophila guanche]SPP74818.1 blast:GON-4-like protein [Drosophila guanche]
MPNSAKKTDGASSASSTPKRTRKRRRIDRQSLDSQVDDDAKEIDRRLRKVARDNSISSEDMHKVVRSVVRNDHVLALVTLKAEDELARERLESTEQQKRGAIIITDTPSVAKLTRAKARELNCTPSISLPSLNDTPVDANGIEALIRDDLHSDEEDEEYTFKEDDFHESDDDPNTTSSDFDSNPCTPNTPLTGAEESPVKLSDDGCFKVPLDKNKAGHEDLRIATRTRSKLCLQETTIEDLQSGFVPPDLEPNDIVEPDMTATDADWMQFLNDFTKPLNNNFLGDEDDLIEDPEYVAVDHIDSEYENAEELRDVNISKKELTDLVSELFAGLLQEGVSFESVELETPQKFLESSNISIDPIEQVSRHIDFDEQPVSHQSELNGFQDELLLPVPVAVTQEADAGRLNSPCKIVNVPADALSEPPELIAVPLAGQPNCFQLAKVIANGPLPLYVPPEQDPFLDYAAAEPSEPPTSTKYSKDRYLKPYDTNFTWEYISVRKHVYAEYDEQFENLRNIQPANPTVRGMGFTRNQHDTLQQQLRIHTQMLAQSYLQTYSHPTLYAMAKKPKELLENLQQRAATDASFNCYNLKEAIELVRQWEHDLNSDVFQEENKKMMDFINKETDLTDGRTRQVPRLAPRIMDLMLDSRVFMYPQYLPRMAFKPRLQHITAWAPSEYQLIAMGLEKHMTDIRNAKRPLRKSADPVRIACKRMAKDMLHDKSGRRIFFKVLELRETDQYNPVKYYFDHERAPPINHILLGFHGGKVLLPRERYQELPSAWQYYIQKTWEKKRAGRTLKPAKASAEASASYIDFVREAIGEDLQLPESLGEAAIPDGGATVSAPTEPPKKSQRKPKYAAKKQTHQSSLLTINVNYVFGGGTDTNTQGAGISVPFQQGNLADNVVNINRTLHTSAECSRVLALPSPPPPLGEDAPPAINYTLDALTNSLKLNESEVETAQQELLLVNESNSFTRTANGSGRNCKRARYQIFKPRIQPRNKSRSSLSPPQSRYHSLHKRLRHKLQQRCHHLITCYSAYLQKETDKYIACAPVQLVHRHFLALDLYTLMLGDLKMLCNNKVQPPATSTPSSSQQKRSRDDHETARIRKANRQEELLRHMLQPDGSEEQNRNDAIFAYNFYDKVEEALLNADRVEDCKKFNKLLQTFDPQHDKVSDLYLKVENLLLPDYPELAEVFLNFLLPAEAAELGKFFQHFMISNASNFINKLNIYFCKQPAQIRKIYACLSELAELPSVSMKKVENKIMPLLKGNQFLCDWFVRQFPQGKPPKRMMPPVETFNLHELQHNTTGEYTETVHDSVDPVTQPKPPAACRLKYINGRMFYGSKILLPAKLSFMAASIYNEQLYDVPAGSTDALTCVHGIRSHGEKLLSLATSVDSDDAADRSEEDDASRGLIIDTTGDEQNSSSSIEMCDDANLKAHAVRLNASLYGNQNFGATSTPNASHSQGHHPNARKTAINFGELSPRKQANCSGLSPLTGLSPHMDKRKSPTKKVRSPQNQTQPKPRLNVPPMVVIHETRPPPSPAIECAKRLRTLIDQESARDSSDNKAGIRVIAQAKQKPAATLSVPKVEPDTLEERDLLSDSGASRSLPLSPQSLSPVKMDLGQSEEEELEPLRVSAGNTPQHVITTQFDSDEDCKLDVVASLANFENAEEASPASVAASTSKPASPPYSCSKSAPWTREEDKVILTEMKLGARDREQLIRRMRVKLKNRNINELRTRHQFLMDFLSKLQGK